MRVRVRMSGIVKAGIKALTLRRVREMVEGTPGGDEV